MVPSIDGTQLHFDNVGLYDALFVMQDVESKTLWNHITGEALYGPHVGGGLSRLFLRGVEGVRGFVNYSDMWLNLRDTLLHRTKEQLLVNVYWSGTDDVAHTYGPDDERFACG